jgi:hypothetical protein
MREFARPDGIVTRTVCAPTGLLPGPYCPSPTRELFVAGTEPSQTETYYVRSPDGAIRIDPPLEARAWAQDAGIAIVGPQDARSDGLVIVTPAPGTVLYLAPELPKQQILLRATVGRGVTRVTFAVDGVLVGETAAGDPNVAWTLTPGIHTLSVGGVLADGSITYTTTKFEVKR